MSNETLVINQLNTTIIPKEKILTLHILCYIQQLQIFMWIFMWIFMHE